MRTVRRIIDDAISDPKSLIGCEENSILDFKSEPYRLDSLPDRLELAKDCSAFANAAGGVIIIGVSTTKDPTSAIERASELRPIPQELVDLEKVYKQVQHLVYPQLHILLHKIQTTIQNKFIYAIEITPQSDKDKYFLVRGETMDGSRGSLHVVAIYRRMGSNCEPWPASEIHRHLHQGRFGQDEGTFVSRQAAGKMSDRADELLEQEIAKSDIDTNSEEAFFFIQFEGKQRSKLENFFPGSQKSVVASLNEMHSIRRYGFNFRLGVQDRAGIDGDVVRLPDNGYNALSINSYGVVTVVIRQKALTWASEKRGIPATVGTVINSIALIEEILESCRIVCDVLMPRAKTPYRTHWRCGMRGMLKGRPLLLLSGKTGEQDGPIHKAQVDSFVSDWTESTAESSNALAYEITSEVYSRFGWDPAAIPYSVGELISHEDFPK